MRFCNSLILVSLTSRGAGTGTVDEAVFAGVGGFLPPVSHMMVTIRNASPMRSQDWTFFGRSPCGFGTFSCTLEGWFDSLIVVPQFAATRRAKGIFFLPM